MSVFQMPEVSQLPPLFEASQLLGDDTALQQCMARDGYLFLRGLLPADLLLQLRDKITGILAERGWIHGGDERHRARAASLPHREGEEEYLEALRQVIKLESLHSLAHREELMFVMRSILGPTVFPHPLSITRLVFPHAPELSTPPHQDYPNNQGTEKLTAAWIPLGDCPKTKGSLAILEGSHRFGVLPLQFHLGPGSRAALLDDRFEQCRWVASDFKLGDVILFPSLTVHRALDNCSDSELRLSVDFRYQPEGEALTPGCLKPHFKCLEWSEVYRGWESDELHYYWEKKRFEMVPWRDELQSVPEGHIEQAMRQEYAYNKAVRARYARHLGKK